MMKKLLILLAALSGLACAADTYKHAAKEVPTDRNYTLTLTLKKVEYGGHTTAPLLVLGEHAVLTCQQGRYLGVAKSKIGRDIYIEGKLPGAYNEHTYKASAGQTTGWFIDSHKMNGLKGTTITIQGDTAAGTTTLTFSQDNEQDTTLTFDSFLNCCDIAVNASQVKGFKKDALTVEEGYPIDVLLLGVLIGALAVGASWGLVIAGKRKQK